MSKDPLPYLKHIRAECHYITSIIETGIKKHEFLEDETLKRAVTRSLEIIGEASKNIPPPFRDRWNSIHWKNMAGMRDRLIHGYMGIDYLIVWDVIKNKIPPLKNQIESIIESEES